MTKYLTNLYYKIHKFGIWSLVILFSGVLTCAYFASKINFEEDITNVLPKGEDEDITAKVIQQLNFSDKITVIVEAENENGEKELSNAASQFLDSIQKLERFITDIQGRFDNDQIEETFNFVYAHLPLLLEKEDYDKIEGKIKKDSIEEAVHSSYNTLISPSGIIAGKYILKDPLGISFIALNKLRSIGIANNFELKDGFVTTTDGNKALLFITPKHAGTETDKNAEFVDRLYEIQKSINEKYAGELQLSYFGAPFIALANARQIKQDIQNTVLISVSILMVLLILFYRKVYIPLILFIPAICGGLFSLALMYFIKDSISAISISIGAILLGITIDYALHIVTHYRENTDIRSLYKNITVPILTSSLTTAAAFLCLLFVNSEVLRDLGLFASVSVIISAVASLIIIPHLYKPKKEFKKNILDKFSAYPFHKNKALLVICSGAVIVGLFTFFRVGFNTDLSDLNYVPKDIQKTEEKLEKIGNFGAKSIYLSVYGDSQKEVLATNYELSTQLDSLKKEGLIKEYSSLGKIVIPEYAQRERITRWNNFWEEHNEDSVIYHVKNFGTDLGFKASAFNEFSKLITKEYSPISLEKFRSAEFLVLDEFLTEKDSFYTFSTLLKIEEENREEIIKSLSKENVLPIDRKNLNEKFLGQLKNDFNTLINISFVVVFVILLLFFRRIELALISMVPVVLTGFVSAGAMYLLNLELNIFSTIVTTLILGLGIDFSIFMTSGLQEEYTTGKKVLKTYRTSILLAVITTVLALGSLIFAKHPALLSISTVTLIGIISAVIITFVLYPVLFKTVLTKRAKKGKSPISLRLFLNSILSFAYYGLGGILYSIFGLIFMYLVPLNKKFKMKLYRKVIGKFLNSVLYTNYFVKEKVQNPHWEKFKKPAIIIANHTSFLDTLCFGKVKTPFIFLVNDWVYKSPIFGKAVQLAGYYPVSSGLEQGEKELVEFVEKGYSLVIFPEGTRSRNGEIGRFHKGAFYMAAKYNIDVVPIYIHGNADLLPKGDYIIYDGKETMEIGERIVISEENPTNYKTLTKNISRDFKEKYQEIRNREEGVNYFRQKVFLSFLYKTADIVSAAKNEFETNKGLYHSLWNKIEKNAKISRIGNDLGIWDVMLTLQQPKRKVRSFISDKNNRRIAKQSYFLKIRSITYTEKLEDLKGDVLLITDCFDSDSINLTIQKGEFNSIIIAGKLYESLDLHENIYVLKEEGTNFVTLKKREIEK